MKQLPNMLSVSRIILLPAHVWFVWSGMFWWAFGLLCWMIFSDWLDGVIARRVGPTTFGKFIDPLSDKIVINSLVGVYAVFEPLLLIALVVFLIRDFSVDAVRMYSAGKGFVISADIFGKAKTAVQFLLLVFLQFGLVGWQIVMWVAVGLSVLSGINYLRAILQTRKLSEHYIIENKGSRGFSNPLKSLVYLEFVNTHVKEKVATGAHLDSATIFVAGGDGFFHEVLNAPWASKHRLGFFPMGGGNAITSVFYDTHPFRALKWSHQQIDVMRFLEKDMLFGGIGFDARVVRNSPRLWPAIMGYTIGFLRSMFFSPFSITINGETYRAVNVSFMKVAYIGYGLKEVQGNVHSSDGKIYCVISTNFWARLFRPFGLLLGFSVPGVKQLLLTDVKFSVSRKVPTHIAGDYVKDVSKGSVAISRQQGIEVGK